MTPEYKVALVRALIAGVILAGSTFFVVLPISATAALAAAGATFFGTLATRFLGEGTLDTSRAKQLPSTTVTVTQTDPPPTPGVIGGSGGPA